MTQRGTVHYGMLPNMTWLIGPGGIIHYKAAWTDPAEIEEAEVLNKGASSLRMPPPRKQFIFPYLEPSVAQAPLPLQEFLPQCFASQPP